FIPEGTPLTVLRTRRVTDLWLLMLRLLAVGLLGMALAGFHVRRDAPMRVLLVDRSRSVRSFAEVADSARPLSSDAVVVAFDSVAGVLPHETSAQTTTHAARGSLSAGLVAAHRALSLTPDGRDKTELVIVSPLVREEVDSATARLLALWEGPIRLVRVAAASDIPASVWEVRAMGDDPVAAALGSVPRTQPAMIRVVRTEPTSADSVWAHDSGGALV